MKLFSLDMEIIPGKSAAGFRIGSQLSDYPELLASANVIEYYPGFNLVSAIKETEGILCIRNNFPIGSGNIGFYYQQDTVRLGFNRNEILSSIWLFEGYQGCFHQTIKIGSPLNHVRKLFRIFYDAGDEMYYPDRDEFPDAPAGIAFAASEEGAEAISKNEIFGICIHDWKLLT